MSARSRMQGHTPVVSVRPATTEQVIDGLHEVNANLTAKIDELRAERRGLEKRIGLICETIEDRGLAIRIMEEFQWAGRQKLMSLGMEP